MAPSVFLDRDSPPSVAAIAKTLGKAASSWEALRANLEEAYAPLAEKWSYSGKKYGWSLQLRQGKKTVLYLVPGEGSFLASMALSEKACAASARRGLPGALLELIREAPVFPEGRAVRIEVKNKRGVESALLLAALRMSV